MFQVVGLLIHTCLDNSGPLPYEVSKPFDRKRCWWFASVSPGTAHLRSNQLRFAPTIPRWLRLWRGVCAGRGASTLICITTLSARIKKASRLPFRHIAFAKELKTQFRQACPLSDIYKSYAHIFEATSAGATSVSQSENLCLVERFHLYPPRTPYFDDLR